MVPRFQQLPFSLTGWEAWRVIDTAWNRLEKKSTTVFRDPPSSRSVIQYWLGWVRRFSGYRPGTMKIATGSRQLNFRQRSQDISKSCAIWVHSCATSQLSFLGLPRLRKKKNTSWLVVWTPLKNISKLGWLFPNIWENRKCSKPPTS